MTDPLRDPSLRQATGTADRLLTLIKTDGPETAAALGRALGTTGENARQQLVKLAAEGLVEARAEIRGVGRPAQIWHLTDRGQARFPDAHAELTVALIRHVRDLLGEEALDRLITAREAETRRAYDAALADAADPEARLRALARQRSAEGYMAEIQPAPDGDGWLLIENHCPICAAATACQGFCRAELAVFRAVLGPGCTITREDHVPAGGRRCSYRVRAAAGTTR